MWLADTSIKRPVFATMFILALVVLGAINYPNIGVDLFPKVDFPIVNVTTLLRGGSPEVIDIDVTDRIEEALNTINGVKSIISSSTANASIVTVEFSLERDIDLAVQDVREKISLIRSRLPRDVEEPVIEKVNPDASPIIWMNLSGQRSVRELSSYADEVLKERIQRINGVGSIRLGGMRLRQIQIWLNPEKMKAYQVTAGEVISALQRENIELPGGRIEDLQQEYSVKIKGEFRRVSDIGRLVLAYYRGAPVRLEDIGRVEDGAEERRSIVRFNGVPAVGLGVQKQSGTNTVEVANRVKKEIVAISKELPPGMALNIAFDQATFIVRSIDEVKNHLLLGGLLAILAVFIFLKNLRTTLISAIALPVSVVSTFMIMKIFDFTFNNMTMLALSLSIGILIDDAIIVIENIYRHVEEGMAPKEAASFATSEIGLAVMATTIAIVAIFLPVAFMKGIIGRFFLQFALTVVFAVTMSMIVSFTLTPMMASIFIKHKPTAPGLDTVVKPAPKRKRFIGFKYFENWYRHILAVALRQRGLVLISAFLIFVFGMYMTRFIGKEFVPAEDQGRFIVRLEAPIDYNIDKADQLFGQAEKLLRATPEVSTVFYALGFGARGESNRAMLFVNLIPKAERKRNQEEIKASVRKQIRAIPGLKGTAEDIALIGGGIRNVPIQYNIRGGDLAALNKYAREISEKFAALPGIVDVDTSLEAGKPELQVLIDRDRAADQGVSVGAIAETINILIGGQVEATKYRDEGRGRRYDIRARLNPEDRQGPDDLGRLMVRSRDGRLVELSSVVRVVEGRGPSVINRVDRQRAITIFASLEGKPLGEAMGELNDISASVLPLDFSTGYKGMAETMGESFQYLIFAILLGIAMAYMILAAQFESFIHPFTVLLSMPLSLIGAFGALMITGQTISIFSMIGLILLMGLVKKNAILLVDYTNVLRSRGLERKEALLQACPVRLRPIMMTTFAMICGMIPVAFGVGEGSETRAPMGIAVIGGLLTSLFLTLIVVPAAYDLFDDLIQKVMKRKTRS